MTQDWYDSIGNLVGLTYHRCNSLANHHRGTGGSDGYSRDKDDDQQCPFQPTT